ncbi:L,D-transpeptidase [Bordetella genomosp. 11]|uniref:L,D-transpeptidase n=1 Tax=Bordetella genomosp. 11 TaxID=1416808 RepID=A0A261UHA3_9BORD|nr:L,D-transpeptidase [Bordetella genomosp. 11]OZI60600.1 hypothetical protein CAL28_14465 [Bordetella genomosp. 11]
MKSALRTGMASVLACAALAWSGQAAAQAIPTPDDLADAYRRTVRQQLHPPSDDIRYYATSALLMLGSAGITLNEPQYLVVVDRSPNVQAILVYWLGAPSMQRLIGASPVSTGRIGQFDHFQTPTGVFDHSVTDGDFRAEGTKNEFGIRGYGRKGMRVYDFGWQQALRGWGRGGMGTMRLQMHATDPDILESRLGRVQSKGCVRIPASLNVFLDRFGVLDADYEAEARAGRPLWVLSPDRTPVDGAGRYLVIVDSGRTARPPWSPAPR